MIVGIPVYQDVDLFDAIAPHEILKWMDPALDSRLIAQNTDGPIVTREGFGFKPTHSFSDTPRLDVLWAPGGEPRALAPTLSG